PQVQLGPLYDLLMASTADLGVIDVGMYALLSMRIEKGFGIWTREFSRDYTARESGLARFVAYDKPGFIGRDAALRERDATPARQLVLLEVAATDADASFYEPIWAGDERIGFITSSAYGHTCGRSLSMGYVASAHAAGGTKLEVTVLGERRACTVLGEVPVDPQGSRMRM
ncbi:MAG: glycine cleavage system protein T, partial [Proteobacteria bacterium]|nr:glycine cleavage system protein T [Pseudomonadota bacterium]